MRKEKKYWYSAVAMLTAFVLWTAVVSCVDVQPIGPQGSVVGLAAVNGLFHEMTGVHMSLYILTDWLSLIPLGLIMGFALLGLMQWIGRKKLRRVDDSLFVLGGFYFAVMAVYVFFEHVVINYRPVLIEGVIEASYPSSTTMLVMCVMPTAVMQLRERMGDSVLRRGICAAMTGFTVFMVTVRLLSGVHWLSDIIGGGLLSAALVTTYSEIVRMRRRQNAEREHE